MLLRGLAASPGVATGRVRVLRSPQDGHRLERGEILVAPMTKPDWVPTIRRAAAVVTDGGGMTCHAAIVSRELGVPCVVGARTATTTLRDGEVVTVDGGQGTVYEGEVSAAAVAATTTVAATRRPHWPDAAATTPRRRRPAVVGGGRWPPIYVNLAMADNAEEVAPGRASTASACCGRVCSPSLAACARDCSGAAAGTVPRPDVRLPLRMPGPSPRPVVTGRSTSARTSSGGWRAASGSSPSRTTR